MDVVRTLWRCDDSELREEANYLMTSVAERAELLGEDAETVIQCYLTGKDVNLISKKAACVK